MSKLLKLKPYLTIHQAAKHLTSVLQEEVSESDVLGLALDGHLQLSVHVTDVVMAKVGERIIDVSSTHNIFPEVVNLTLGDVHKEIIADELASICHKPNEIISFDGEFREGVVLIADVVADLLMIGDGGIYIRDMQVELLTGNEHAEQAKSSHFGIFLEDQNGDIYWLYSFINKDLPWEDLRASENLVPSSTLPYHCLLVVRSEVLIEFLKKLDALNYPNEAVDGEEAILIDHEQNSEPSPKARNSYLRLIQALAQLATDGLTGQPNVDAEAVIAALKAKGISCPVGNKAISNYLKDAMNLTK